MVAPVVGDIAYMIVLIKECLISCSAWHIGNLQNSEWTITSSGLLKIIIEQCLGPQLKTGSHDIQVAAQHLTGARRSDTEIQMSSPEVTRAKHRFLRIHPG